MPVTGPYTRTASPTSTIDPPTRQRVPRLVAAVLVVAATATVALSGADAADAKPAQRHDLIDPQSTGRRPDEISLANLSNGRDGYDAHDFGQQLGEYLLADM